MYQSIGELLEDKSKVIVVSAYKTRLVVTYAAEGESEVWLAPLQKLLDNGCFRLNLEKNSCNVFPVEVNSYSPYDAVESAIALANELLSLGADVQFRLSTDAYGYRAFEQKDFEWVINQSKISFADAVRHVANPGDSDASEESAQIFVVAE